MKIVWTFKFLDTNNGKEVKRVLTYEDKTLAQIIASLSEWLPAMDAWGFQFLDQEVQIEDTKTTK